MEFFQYRVINFNTRRLQTKTKKFINKNNKKKQIIFLPFSTKFTDRRQKKRANVFLSIYLSQMIYVLRRLFYRLEKRILEKKNNTNNTWFIYSNDSSKRESADSLKLNLLFCSSLLLLTYRSGHVLLVEKIWYRRRKKCRSRTVIWIR